MGAPVYVFSDLPDIGDDFRVQFPDPRNSHPDGILGQGGNLSPGVLLSAYEQGIFPWYAPGDPILWWSPDPRCVIFLDNFHISRRKRRSLAKTQYHVTMDSNFEGVIRSCATVGRKGGTWIVPEMIEAYCRLHAGGHAHSVEVWDGEALVGGLYGVSVAGMFCGESMFSVCSGASTLALAALCDFLRYRHVHLIDSQLTNPHIESLGGQGIPREDYLRYLARALQQQQPPDGGLSRHRRCEAPTSPDGGLSSGAPTSPDAWQAGAEHRPALKGWQSYHASAAVVLTRAEQPRPARAEG